MTLRRARPDDARPIASILLRSWQTSYRGILPDPVLDAQRLQHFLPYWEAVLAEVGETRTWVAERSGTVVGFAHAGPSRDEAGDPDRIAELYAMYVDPDHTGGGIGTRLMEAVMAHFAAGPWLEATLWVLEGNRRARAFYERNEWQADGVRTEVASATGHTLIHTRYRIEVRR